MVYTEGSCRWLLQGWLMTQPELLHSKSAHKALRELGG